MFRSLGYHGEGRERIDEVLRQHGITVEPLAGDGDERRLLCRRDDVAVRLTILRNEFLPSHPQRIRTMIAFTVLATAQSTGWRFWRLFAANRLCNEVMDLFEGEILRKPQKAASA